MKGLTVDRDGKVVKFDTVDLFDSVHTVGRVDRVNRVVMVDKLTRFVVGRVDSSQG